MYCQLEVIVLQVIDHADLTGTFRSSSHELKLHPLEHVAPLGSFHDTDEGFPMEYRMRNALAPSPQWDEVRRSFAMTSLLHS